MLNLYKFHTNPQSLNHYEDREFHPASKTSKFKPDDLHLAMVKEHPSRIDPDHFNVTAPWPEAEPYIMKSPELAFYYALNILDRRWTEAEPYIMKDPEAASLYARHLLKKPWPEAEPYIMKDPEAASLYARQILKKPWPEAEPYIMKAPYWAFVYAYDVLDARWPEAEPYIRKDESTWREYKELFNIKED